MSDIQGRAEGSGTHQPGHEKCQCEILMRENKEEGARLFALYVVNAQEALITDT